ncbi:aspartyl-phosphate phosphatase Spo0E family protein [Schinkia azotoformans]|nr:aspartyl-phosphate phosphatase Spo0E family protein [Schinkia azotoformans]MEC1743335.1 aspartyl-phosphate phosphatase Spo0E family protein [Schinkia azotoformans]MEC1769495.1 aspartyl-phosphate phosphatase Spo0E family protein [Schinkia azotoformans]MEC1788660.1 aspartyl-phosphate phosphatase Spo0E family protein [Schinkia azotoformans]MED4377331.1 aspartyl-phosphate phosphatase Spo0E family protein [Schinkia azotoformans]MED4420168.1 aspartyl-phosphate phosphatase Spo0E family protein [Sc
MTTNTNTNTSISLEIEYLRSELIESGIKNGLNHPTTVYLSQELDKLLNKCKIKTE